VNIIAWILFGLLAGAVAKPGKHPQGCIVTIAVGTAGVFVGLAHGKESSARNSKAPKSKSPSSSFVSSSSAPCRRSSYGQRSSSRSLCRISGSRDKRHSSSRAHRRPRARGRPCALEKAGIGSKRI
jgi:hypothetical protein